ncbi:MAG TPA: dynamin family protein [Thermoanaerobaculia bacterium]|jgi:hypothetical protein|nr:dynamin family protein [Thermoanaerobaculia bacterium]
MTREDFEWVSGFAQQLGLPDAVIERLDSARKRLATEWFRVAFVGESGAGKSALANALLGAGALPSAALPCTAAPTRAVWGEVRGTTVKLRSEPGDSDSPKVVAIRELTPFVTRLNPRFAAQAAFVEEAVVHHPAPVLAGGVEFLDLPGLDLLSAAGAHFAEAHAVLVVLGVGEAPSERLASRLARLLREDLGWIGLVVTKVDLIPEPECTAAIDRAVERLRDAVCRRLKADFVADGEIESILASLAAVEVFDVSARQALQGKLEGEAVLVALSGLARLEGTLAHLATGGREKALDRIAAGVLRASRSEILRGFEGEAARRKRRSEALASIYRSASFVLRGLEEMAREEMAALDAASSRARDEALLLANSLSEQVRDAVSRTVVETPMAEGTTAEVVSARLARRVALTVDAVVSHVAEQVQIKLHEARKAALDSLQAFAVAGDYVLDQIDTNIAQSADGQIALPPRLGLADRLRSLWRRDLELACGHGESDEITLPALALAAGRIAACLAPSTFSPVAAPPAENLDGVRGEDALRIAYRSAILPALDLDLARWRDANAAQWTARLAIGFDALKEEIGELLARNRSRLDQICGREESLGLGSERARIEEIVRRAGES